MSWWNTLKGWFVGDPGGQAATDVAAEPKAAWWDADDPKNPFDYPILDLTFTETITATSTDPSAAAKSVSWGSSIGEELDISRFDGVEAEACALRFPVAASLPEGLLYVPWTMDQKWVLAWRSGHIIAARSWTGAVELVADARLEREELVVHGLRVLEAVSL